MKKLLLLGVCFLASCVSTGVANPDSPTQSAPDIPGGDKNDVDMVDQLIQPSRTGRKVSAKDPSSPASVEGRRAQPQGLAVDMENVQRSLIDSKDPYDVVDAYLAFIERSIEPPSVDAVEYISEAFGKCRTMLPFMESVQAKEYRRRIDALEDRATSKLKKVAIEASLRKLDDAIEKALIPAIPLEVRQSLVEDAWGLLRNIGQEIANDRSSERDGGAWMEWTRRQGKLKTLESSLAAQVVESEYMPKAELWTATARKLLVALQNMNVDRLGGVVSAADKHLTEGARLNASIRMALATNVGPVPSALDLVESITTLQSMSDWAYNRWTSHRVEVVEKWKYSDFSKLSAIAEIDTSRLGALVAEQWQELWNDLYKGCSDLEKLEIIKVTKMGPR